MFERSRQTLWSADACRSEAVGGLRRSKRAGMKISAALSALVVCSLGLLLGPRVPVASAGDASPSPPPVPSLQQTQPVSIEICSSEEQSATNPNLKVGIGFRDLTDTDVTQVKFDILLLDSSGRVVDTKVVSIDGKFAPNELISPHRGSLTGGLLTQPEYPDSSAWNVANHYGSGVEKVRCQLHAATFADGTTWSASP